MFCAENGNDLLQICFNLEEVGVLGLPGAVVPAGGCGPSRLAGALPSSPAGRV